MKLRMAYLALLVFVFVSACSSRPGYVWYSEYPAEQGVAPRKVVEFGDTIAIQVPGQAELSGEFVVGAAGAYNQPLVGPVTVAGMETQQAAEVVKQEISRYVKVQYVTVTLVQYRPARVRVLGEVGRPGSFEIPHGGGVLDALAMAGGLTPFASKDDVYVLRAKPRPTRIRFRFSDLTRPDDSAIRFVLREGDTVLVE